MVIPNVPMQKWDIKSCGAGSLSSVLQHYGDPVSMDEWQEKLPKTKGGVMSIDLVLAAREAGDAGQPICGECYREREFFVMDAADGRLDGEIE